MVMNFGDEFFYFAVGAMTIFLSALGYVSIREDIDEYRHRD